MIGRCDNTKGGFYNTHCEQNVPYCCSSLKFTDFRADETAAI